MYAEINFIAFNCEEYYDIAIEVKVISNTESLNIGKKRGSLTIYIGYSPGVGKTFEMLSNAIELFQSNVDIKIGYIEPHQRDETNALAEQLPKSQPILLNMVVIIFNI